jgi:hypothetical protein
MRRQIALAFVGFGLLTLAVFRPTLHELAHTTPSIRGEPADALLRMWATSHVSRTLFPDPLHLFDAGIFHPLRHTLAFGDHMIGQALAGLPVWLATGSSAFKGVNGDIAAEVRHPWFAFRQEDGSDARDVPDSGLVRHYQGPLRPKLYR